jgi:hypothetical protein
VSIFHGIVTPAENQTAGGLTYLGGVLSVATGNGLTISGGNVVVSLGTGLQFTGGAVAVNLVSGTGISVSGATINTNLSAGSAIAITGTAPQSIALASLPPISTFQQCIGVGTSGTIAAAASTVVANRVIRIEGWFTAASATSVTIALMFDSQSMIASGTITVAAATNETLFVRATIDFTGTSTFIGVMEVNGTSIGATFALSVFSNANIEQGSTAYTGNVNPVISFATTATVGSITQNFILAEIVR